MTGSSLAQNASSSETPNLRGNSVVEPETWEQSNFTQEEAEFISEGLVNLTLDSVESLVSTSYRHACAEHYNRANFAQNLKRCALRNGLRVRDTGKCMQHKQHVSYQCGQCMGHLMICGKKCVRQCCSGSCPHDYKCKKCNNDR